jgi:hypothetical protein
LHTVPRMRILYEVLQPMTNKVLANDSIRSEHKKGSLHVQSDN